MLVSVLLSGAATFVVPNADDEEDDSDCGGGEELGFLYNCWVSGERVLGFTLLDGAS